MFFTASRIGIYLATNVVEEDIRSEYDQSRLRLTRSEWTSNAYAASIYMSLDSETIVVSIILAENRNRWKSQAKANLISNGARF